MNELEKIKRYWEDSLIELIKPNVETFSLPFETTQFISKVGIPKKEFHFITLNPNKSKLRDEFLEFGDDFGTSICLENNSGFILSVDFDNNHTVRYINKNIQSFILFLVEYTKIFEELKKASDEKAASIVSNLQSKYNNLDKSALNNSENWWSIILEQMIHGLL